MFLEYATTVLDISCFSMIQKEDTATAAETQYTSCCAGEQEKMGSMPICGSMLAHIPPRVYRRSANKWDEARNLTYAVRAIRHTRDVGVYKDEQVHDRY
jgi:hypothetical protein